MTKLLGLDLVPLSVPWERRLQTGTLVFFTFLMVGFHILGIILPFYLFGWTSYYWLVLLYFLWMWWDYDTPQHGSRPMSFFRSERLWKPMAEYFPAHLEKTVDLDPNRNYIFGSHPHGIIGVGACVSFMTEATGFQRLFPGLQRRLCTLRSNFMVPIKRELICAWGAIDVSKESITHVLTRMGKGQAVIIVIGGAQEALYARSGSYELQLAKRKGFAKMALKAGADLVPVYTFGENDLYTQADNKPGTGLRNFQEKFKQLTGISPVLFHGRGVFNYTFGFIPYRKSINTIVGKPIKVSEAVENPTQEQIDSLHNAYCAGLVEVFEANKGRFGLESKAHLVFV